MADKVYPKSQLPIRKSENFLPNTFQTETNKKFLSGVVDPLIQPGSLDKLTGYVGKKYGKTYKGSDVYLDTDQTLRSRYQLEPGVTVEKDQKIEKFYDYLDFKNILNYFGNASERDDKITYQEHYSWNPPIDWDKFVNYREYYWVPGGPPSISIFGQTKDVVSTYKVNQGQLSTWVFTPDAVTNNPTITLYRGQTYIFEVNSPGEGFTLRTNYDTGSLIFDPLKTYQVGDLAVYDNKLWRAKNEVIAGDGSTIDLETQDWELVDDNATSQSLNYNNGVTNNGVEVGTLTFTVPLNAPDAIYYQSSLDPNRLGRFLIADIDSNTFINVDKEIVGKQNYKSANGIELSNGMVLEFRGEVEPSKYVNDTWLVEGVGKEIKLIRFADLVPPIVSLDVPEILFDNEGFDTQPFDDASQYPAQKDYITINRSSGDSNPWSRYNRWFHRSVLEYSYQLRNEDFDSPETARAKRPIIEFHPDIKLFNHGSTAKTTVDYIDDFTTDVFSTIEGSAGYSIDGEFLFEGARVLFTADTDGLTNNKIYEVNFIIQNGRRQINLRETTDTESILGQCVLIRRGKANAGKMYDFDGTNWKASQAKTKVNQEPLFDVFDDKGVSFSDQETYPVSTFVGSKIISYKKGNSVIDSELGFSLSYLNIDNVGDILFNWDLDVDNFVYTINRVEQKKNINTGYIKINNTLDNGWQLTSKNFLQPIIDSVKVEAETDSVTLRTVDWQKLPSEHDLIVFKNGEKVTNYTRNNDTFTFTNSLNINDIISIKLVAEINPNTGYYEIPVGLEKNPLNENLNEFTLGEALDHVKTGLEFDQRFTGTLPGRSNLRDISNFQVHSKRFLKHSGISAAALSILVDKEFNIIKGLQYAKKQYSIFKDNFLKKAIEIDFEGNTADFVDNIIEDLTKTKSINSPFADSDMIGSGAFTSINYKVEDTGIKTFTLGEKFDLETLSRKAVYIYLNDVQLLAGRDYTFDSTFGYVSLTVDLVEGDAITIREYVSTSFSHIPPTPTSMGLYKKYSPTKFIDDTYRTPQEVIQGHDGSITLAFGDFRDDLLLELEYRIYNNIKNSYDPEVFDIDKNLGGYYGNALFTKQEFDNVTNQEFLRWVANTNLQYTLNEYFIDGEPFTYTYSNMADPSKSENLPGWWRGVYKYFYDTDRPHRCPWEMLGFSEKPTWWESEYGPAPYTSGNLILWEDIRDGYVRGGSNPGPVSRYARTSILNHLPVDCDGNLLSPLDSGLATNFTLINNKGNFKLGDISPTEYAYRSSSEFPFVTTIALCLLRPYEFIISNFDRYKTKRNAVNQIVDKVTNNFLKTTDLVLPIAGDTLTSGLGFYISALSKSMGKTVSQAQELLDNINVRLSNRLSGFVDKEQQKYLLDSKNPSARSSSIFIPDENFDIIFNVSAPILSVSYSGVIFEKTEGGWIINGYDDVNPYFNYFEAIPNQKDPLISVGGVSETFVVWTGNQKYNNGAIVEYRNDYYRATSTHTSDTTFDTSLWQKLAQLPIKNAVEAQRRRNFNSTSIKQLSYGTRLTSIQDVVDFLLGYQAYLQALGFTFENYSRENQVVQDFQTSAKEFMFWTRQNWSIGSLITLSPGAERLKVTTPVGVVDNLLNSFYEYNILKDNGEPLEAKNIDVTRDFQSFEIKTANTTAGIYFLKINYVLKEHVAVFDDKTVFNDIIFDKKTGYRQERIKNIGFRTVDWDGDYTSPGFLFDNVNIASWQPYKDYKLGDIVNYKSYNYTSITNHTSDDEFDDSNWTILDSTPEKQLIPNYDYRINQMEDYFDVMSQGLGQSQRELARHTIGYQTREYLQNLAEDDTTQFRLYQGFVREKGTANSIVKLFSKIGRSTGQRVELKEEWAFKLGEFGGKDQSKNLELNLKTDNFKLNPQPLLVVSDKQGNFLDRYYRLDQTDFNYAPIPYTTNINQVSYESSPIKTAGYVKIGQTEYTVRTRDDILNLDIDTFNDNDHVWVTFDYQSWTVLRGNYYFDLPIVNVENNETTVTVTFDKRHNLSVDDIIGLDIEGIKGFHKVTSIISGTGDGSSYEKEFSIQIEVDPAPNLAFESSSLTYPILFTVARFESYNTMDVEQVALLSKGSKLFVDKNINDRWEVVEKKKQYDAKLIESFGVSQPLRTGAKVIYANTQKQSIVSIPGSERVVCYFETSTGLSTKQILEPLSRFVDYVKGTFGEELAVSPDNKWLAIGSPRASDIRSNYKGTFLPNETYAANDIVLYAGSLWKANRTVIGDGSTINVYSEDWTQVNNIQALESGSFGGFELQGMIDLYEFSAQQWNYHGSFVAPRPDSDKLFGSKIAFALDGTKYSMVVTAPSTNNDKGRAYIYEYNSVESEWNLITNNNFRGVYEPGGTINATDMLAGRTYTISFVGTTNFLEAGASSNTIGTEFVATEAAEGDGVVTQNTFYPKGSVVYHAGYLWEALSDNAGDGSSITLESNDWIRLDEINTTASLPQSVALEDDGSTLASGILSPTQLAELVSSGDKFGSSLAMNYTGNTLVIGASEADGQYFANYRGLWQANFEYSAGDTVKFEGNYYQLVNEGADAVADGSTLRSYNQPPENGLPWISVGDSTSDAVGKVFVYQKNETGLYKLIQTITTNSLQEINDTGTGQTISSGDLFGYAIDIDYSGSTLVITSPKADKNFQNQGSAYIFKFESDSTFTGFRLKQKIESYARYPNEYFGQSICISEDTSRIAIGASNSPYSLPIRFDQSQTSFDEGRTTFRTLDGYSGAVYVFERKQDRYFLAEKLEDDLSLNESFGYSISCTSNVILVGSPNYISPAPHDATLAFDGDKTGMARLFKKQSGINSLEVIGTQPQTVDIENIKRIALYDKETDVKIQDLEIVDPAKMKILASAERNLSFKTPYDPAIYTLGTEDTVVDNSIAWYSKNVGKLWWNISNAKWINYEQGDTAYRSSNWGRQAEGSSIDVYEWVESKLLPSEWALVADTNEGLRLGISGQPLYPDDTVYSVKELLNTNTGEVTETLYYYWVENKTTIPNGVLGRTVSAAEVANTIADPSSIGNTFIALTDSNKISFYNYKNIVSSDETILNIEYYTNSAAKNAIHNEYQLLTEGVADSVPAAKLERKWIDSLVGYDQEGNRVPDPDLPEKQKYGILFRPKQSMFEDRKQILGQAIQQINGILTEQPFADFVNFQNLNLLDEQPDESLYLYDVKVSTIIDLETVGTVRVTKAELSANIIDNEITSIDIINPGFGYRPQELFDQEVTGIYQGPSVSIDGDGAGAEAVTHIDGQGRIVAVVVTNPGEKYTYANVTVRNFSVLVETDSTANNYWSIYAWDDVRKTFFRSASQGFDTTKYWSYKDWWKKGYSETSRIIKEITEASEEPTIIVQVGDLIRIKEYGSGGWAVFEKLSETTTTLLDNYTLVGRKNGTITLSQNLYNISISGVGFDNITSFDTGLYDLEPTQELRNILKAVKEDIFISDYTVEWNKLFFNSVRFAFHEQTYIDWAFKTSFLNAIHDVGELEQPVNYRNDNLDSYISYIDEVKPYRTTVREYVSRYNKQDINNAAITDFDLPSVYSEPDGKVVTVDELSNQINSYPYKWWFDNRGYSIIEIDIAYGGSGYTSPPAVVIEGNGAGAKAQAYISSGRVVGVSIIDEGKGYTLTPTISLVGGNGSSSDKAKAVAILGNSKARTLQLGIKFDRINKEGIYQNFKDSQTFTASGSTSVFDLKYAPTRDKSGISIKINGQIVLGSDYSISLYRSTIDTFGLLKGRIIFNQAPSLGDTIDISYSKNDELLDSVNRINKYYSPTSGMKGTDLDQLMTGIDYSGVQIQGTTFDVTGGWDALPWFTDSWDSVEASADYYHVCDGSTTFVTLPYTPAEGQEINIYLKRAGEEVLPTIDNLQYSEQVADPPIVRIDDPYFLSGNDSSTSVSPNAQMPTFYGDGSTNSVEIGQYISTNAGDILVFRPVESDGAVTITDPNIVDTNLSGGSLSVMDSAYATATGITAEEIKIEGGRFIGPEEVQAPEENIPGQILDGLSIKVFQSTQNGAAPLQSRVFNADGSTATYDIGQKIYETKSIIVYVDGIKKVIDTDYTVDVKNQTVTFLATPSVDELVEILSIGIGGIAILDYQEFTADGDTSLFLTNANYNETTNIFVTLNGVETDAVFTNSTGVVDSVGRTLVQFGSTPNTNDVIKIIALGASTDVDSSALALVRVNNQTIVHDGSTRNYDLDNFVSLERDSAISSMIVDVNGTKLIGVDTIYAVYDGITKDFRLGQDPLEAPGAILSANISVFINGERKTFISDYVYNGTTKVLTIEADLTVGDTIKIENDLRSQYSIREGNLVIDPSVSLTIGDEINVLWLSEYPSMQISTDRISGGKVVYELPFTPLSVSYVWVYKNGIKQIQDSDYYVSLPRGVIYLNEDTTDSDSITIVSFGSSIFRLPSAFEINKDMLNVYRYNRYSRVSDVQLASDLNYYDTEIKVTNAEALFQPISSRNIPGAIIINNERIEYLQKNGNTLSQLRRGVQGSSIAEVHTAGSSIVDISPEENLPYSEDQLRTDFVSDGSSILIGPLDFTPTQNASSTWYSSTIPEEYNRCDLIEVFVAGRRLRKTPLTVFDEALGPTSPSGDKQIEAEFSVDGVNPYIRLTTPVSAGTRITVIKRVGQTWYDKGETTVTTGATLLENTTPISKFIAAKTTSLPE